MSELVFVALGSNLGDRAAYLASARNALALLRGTRLVAASAVEETAPFGPSAQGPYLNQMVALRTAIAPLPLLAELQRVERSLGRVRRARWSARTIDLDIVRYGTRRITLASLTVPHPDVASRPFWLRELDQLGRLLATAA